MKKKLIFGTAMMLLSVSGIAFSNSAANTSEDNTLLMENIEALTQNEGYLIICMKPQGTCWVWDNGCVWSGCVYDYCINM